MAISSSPFPPSEAQPSQAPAVRLIGALALLRREYLARAADTERSAVLNQAIGLVNETGGPVHTLIPLRHEAKAFVAGSKDPRVLQLRAREHITAKYAMDRNVRHTGATPAI